MVKKVFIFLFDGFSDWEIAYLSPEINKSESFDLIYFSKDGKTVSSMGGLKVSPDQSLNAINANEIDMLILPGGTAWETDQNDAIEKMVQNLFNTGVTIGAICAATTYLGKLGILDKIKHTSNDLNYLKKVAPQYKGEANYADSLAVSDQNIITANGIAPIEFAKAVFLQLNVYNPENTEKWFQLFKNGIWPG